MRPPLVHTGENPACLKGFFSQISLFLVDASGVLYNDDGVIPGAIEAIAKMQKQAPVFLVTNNSSHHIQLISDTLSGLGFSFSPSHIISSGLGLSRDTFMRRFIEGKRIGIWGGEPSYEYLKQANCKEICPHYEDVDCIVLTSSLGEKAEGEYQRLKQYLLGNNVPIICCNPDRVIRGTRGKMIPVMGHYARRLEEELEISVMWIGKPYLNFSLLVKQILLDDHGIDIQKRASKTVFFDDNALNIGAMTKDLGIQGCLVHSSGISFNRSIKECLAQTDHPIAFTISTLKGI